MEATPRARLEEMMPNQTGIPALITRLADGLGKLVTDHITLAKLELSEDAKAMGIEVAKILAFVPFVLVGYAFLCAAAAFAIAPFVGTVGALAIVGFVNVVGGGVGLYSAAMKLKSRPVMDGTLAEVKQTTQVIAQTASGKDASVRNTVKELSNGQ